MRDSRKKNAMCPRWEETCSTKIFFKTDKDATALSICLLNLETGTIEVASHRGMTEPCDIHGASDHKSV